MSRCASVFEDLGLHAVLQKKGKKAWCGNKTGILSKTLVLQLWDHVYSQQQSKQTRSFDTFIHPTHIYRHSFQIKAVICMCFPQNREHSSALLLWDLSQQYIIAEWLQYLRDSHFPHSHVCCSLLPHDYESNYKEVLHQKFYVHTHTHTHTIGILKLMIKVLMCKWQRLMTATPSPQCLLWSSTITPP